MQQEITGRIPAAPTRAVHRRKRPSWGYIKMMTLLGVLLYCAILIAPLFLSVYYSFTNMNLLKASSDFVGFRNYVNLAKDPTFSSFALLHNQDQHFGHPVCERLRVDHRYAVESHRQIFCFPAHGLFRPPGPECGDYQFHLEHHVQRPQWHHQHAVAAGRAVATGPKHRLDRRSTACLLFGGGGDDLAVARLLRGGLSGCPARYPARLEGCCPGRWRQSLAEVFAT